MTDTIRPLEDKVLDKVVTENRLHPNQIRAINLLHGSDLTENDVAKQMGLTVNTLRKLLREAEKNLLPHTKV